MILQLSIPFPKFCLEINKKHFADQDEKREVEQFKKRLRCKKAERELQYLIRKK